MSQDGYSIEDKAFFENIVEGAENADRHSKMPEHRALWRNNNNIAKASLSNDINNREHLPTETQLEIPTSISELPGTANSLSDTSNLSKWSPVTPSSKREDATILDLAKAFLEAKQVKAKSESADQLHQYDSGAAVSDLRPADLNLTNFNRALAKNASNVKVEEVAVMKEILGLVPKTVEDINEEKTARIATVKRNTEANLVKVQLRISAEGPTARGVLSTTTSPHETKRTFKSELERSAELVRNGEKQALVRTANALGNAKEYWSDEAQYERLNLEWEG
ncbi:hypothetical protein PZA11_003673 [Diplocarpon coronariae]